LDFTRHLTALRSKGYSVRAYIMWIVAVVLIPGLLFGGWMVYESAHSQRDQAERIADREAREVAATIDREMVNAANIARSLAGSHFLQTGDLAAFHKHVMEVAKQTETRIVLGDPERDLQLIHSGLPYGPVAKRGLPPQRMEAERRALKTNEPVLSDVFLGPNVRHFLVSLVMPVKREGAPPYILSIAIPSQKFANILATNQISPEWVVGIIDSAGVIVARSEKHQEFVGTKVYGGFTPDRNSIDGIQTSLIRDGRVFRWSRRKSESTGWFISVGIPESVLNAPVRRAMLTYAGAALALFGIAMALSYYFGGRISQSIGSLGIDREPTREEFDVLFQSHPSGVLVLDSGGHIVLANSRVEQKFGYRHDELIGKPIRMLCPKHLHTGVLSWPSLMGVSNELTGERKDGSEFPIEIAANQVHTRSGNFIIMIWPTSRSESSPNSNWLSPSASATICAAV
jgi:PAS domain S-box-containing protein